MPIFSQNPNGANCPWLQRAYPNDVFQASGNHYYGTADGQDYVNDHAIYYWDLSSILPNAIIQSATLQIYADVQSIDRDFYIEVWRLIRSGIDYDDASYYEYDESANLDWDGQGADGAADIDTKLGEHFWDYPGDTGGLKQITLDVDEVAKWFDGQKSNYGVLLKSNPEQETAGATYGTRVRVRGTAFETVGHRPLLTINWLPAGGFYQII